MPGRKKSDLDDKVMFNIPGTSTIMEGTFGDSVEFNQMDKKGKMLTELKRASEVSSDRLTPSAVAASTKAKATGAGRG
jgi:hypothetical protein